MWQRRFGGSPDALGRKITLNDSPYEVIGVMPREFYFLPARDIDIWIPTSFSAQMLTQFYWHDLHCVARLKPGVTLQQARESMAALSLRVSAPDVDTPRAAVVTPLREELAGKTRMSLIVLLSASAAVLLIACVNLANLLMSRWATRRREVAVRAALGAGRWRLIRQFLVESLTLAGLGAVAGLALAIPVMRFLETLAPETMAAAHLTLDWRVLAFSAGVAIAVTRRINEIGVRMALGATSRDILLSFSRRGLALTFAGLGIGLVLSAIAARFMTTLLYGFRPDYLPTVAVVSLILLVVAALACFVPARRAANVDPLVVLRNEE
jgi:ABC-type antimicrobial peptide transport system permease subunit